MWQFIAGLILGLVIGAHYHEAVKTDVTPVVVEGLDSASSALKKTIDNKK